MPLFSCHLLSKMPVLSAFSATALFYCAAIFSIYLSLICYEFSNSCVCVSVCMINARCYARIAHLLLVCILVDADLSVNQSISNGPLFGSQWFSSLLNFYFFWLFLFFFSFRFIPLNVWNESFASVHLFNHMLPIFAAMRH